MGRILLINYSNGSYIEDFPSNLGYIASSLLQLGDWEVVIYDQASLHSNEEDLSKYLKSQPLFDIIAIGFVAGYYQYKKIKQISKVINESPKRPNLYILGGHGPSPAPNYFMRIMNADMVVVGEGEETIKEIVKEYKNTKDYSKIKGIVYKKITDFGYEYIINESRPQIENLDSILSPAYSLFDIEYYRKKRYPCISKNDLAMPVISSRGCKFNCTFCCKIMKGYRIRSNENIIKEIDFLKDMYKVNYIAFYDDLLMNSEKRIISFCDDLIKSNLNIKWWCDGRFNYAKEDVLQRMKEAGCVFINYGLESYNDDILKVMKKQLTTKIIERGVIATKKVGINMGLNIMFGNVGETLKHLENTTNFILKYYDREDFRTVRPVTPYPGSQLYNYAIEKGLLNGVEDFYENKHINSDLIAVNFTDLSNEEFMFNVKESNKKFAKKYYELQLESKLEEIDNIDENFRGYR